jgi:phage baseplate assembly protein V
VRQLEDLYCELGYSHQKMGGAVENMVLICTVEKVDPDNAKVTVKIEDAAESDFIPVLARRGFGGSLTLWLPEKGEQVVVLSPYGDPNYGIVIGSIPRDEDLITKLGPVMCFKDGTTIQYNESEHKLIVKNTKKPADFKADIQAGDTSIQIDSDAITLKAAKINLTGEVVCSSKVSMKQIDCSGEAKIDSASIAKDAAIGPKKTKFTEHFHPVPTPQGGFSGTPQ